MPKNPAAAIGISGLLGLIFPMCECGSVIVIRRFIKKGLPLSSAVTYMLAAPIVSPLVALSTFAAFKGQNPWLMTSLRLSLGYLIAVGGRLHRAAASRAATSSSRATLAAPNASRRAGLQRRRRRPPRAAGFLHARRDASLPKKLLLAVQSATADFLDVAFFFIIGTAIASVFNTAVNQEIILPFATQSAAGHRLPHGPRRASSPCAAPPTRSSPRPSPTFPFAAKLGFLLFGPMFDLKLFWLYGLLFKRRFVVAARAWASSSSSRSSAGASPGSQL